MRSVEKIPSIPEIRTGLVELGRYLFAELGMGAVMWELGSFAGESAELLSPYFRTIHCVDPWEDACGAPSVAEVEASFDERAKLCGNFVKYKADSLAVLSMVVDGSVDFVYIDAGAHSYAESMRDLQAWWPKVRPGGFLGGHDYEYPLIHAADTFPGVKNSVNDFFGQHPDAYGIRLFPDTSYVVRKP